MFEQHERVEEFFKKFSELEKKDPTKAKKAFEDFSWHLERHFFTEEMVILRDYNSPDTKIYPHVSKILEEHKTMLEMMDKIKKETENKKKADIKSLLDLLVEHRNYEDEFFYPMLDLELSKEQKVVVFAKMSEYYKW